MKDHLRTRESIILKFVELFEASDKFMSVRRLIPTFDELKSVPSTDMPFIAVHAGLPVPAYIKSDQTGFNTILTVDLTIYSNNNVEPDVEISDILTEAWGIINTFQDDNNRAEISSPALNWLPPYAIISLPVDVHYVATRTII